MKIEIIIFSRLLSYGGGRETWLNNFLPELKKRCKNLDFRVLYLRDCHSVENDLISSAFAYSSEFSPVDIIGPGNKLRSILRIFQYTLKTLFLLLYRRPDVVVGVGSYTEGFPIFFYKFFLRKKVTSIIWLRGVWSKESSNRHNIVFRKINIFLERMFLKKADLIIANGGDTAYEYEKRGFFPHIIANAIPSLKFKNVQEISSENIRVSYVGRLSREKGFDIFCESVRQFCHIYPNSKISFDVVGEGPLLNLINSESLKYLNYIGPITNDKMPDYLSKITAGVALTLSGDMLGGGGVSNALIELIMARRVVIAWESPIFLQVLEDDECYYVSEGNIAGLVEAYRSIEINFESAKSKAAKAFLKAPEYTMDMHVDKFLKLINENVL